MTRYAVAGLEAAAEVEGVADRAFEREVMAQYWSQTSDHLKT